MTSHGLDSNPCHKLSQFGRLPTLGVRLYSRSTPYPSASFPCPFLNVARFKKQDLVLVHFSKIRSI